MAITIENNHSTITADTDTLKRIGDKALHDADRKDWALSVTLVDDGFIRELNKNYLKRDYPTDVLAFPIDDIDAPDDDGINILGDIYISLDQAQAHSAEYDVSFGDEVSRLMLHGLFHLLGYSHDTMAPFVEKYLTEHIQHNTAIPPIQGSPRTDIP